MSKKHLAKVAALPCLVCGGPAEVHHIRHPALTGMSQRAPDFFTLPLCPEHHRGDSGFHKLGRETWERIHGEQFWHVERVLRRLYG